MGRKRIAKWATGLALLGATGLAHATPDIGITAETLGQTFLTAVHAGSYAHVVPSTGSSRALIVTLGTTAGTMPVANIGSVVWDPDTTVMADEQTLTCDASFNIIIGTNRRIAICTLLAPTPSAGNGQVTITFAGLATVVDTFTSSATTMSGVASFGTATTSGPTRTFMSWTPNCTGPTSYVCALSVTTVADQVLFDLVGQGEPSPAGSRSFTAGGAGQNEREESATGSAAPHNRVATSVTIATGTSTTLSWTYGGSTATNGVGQVVLPINAASSVTAAAPGRIEAVRYGETGTRVAWRTEEEVSHLGFQVWREVGGVRTRLPAGFLPGSMFATGDYPLAGRRHYELWDQGPLEGGRYWVEEIATTGSSRWHGPIVTTSGDAARGRALRAPVPSRLASARPFAFSSRSAPGLVPAAPGPWERSFPRTRAATPRALLTARDPACANLPASRPSVKLAVSATGWYRIGAAALVAAGLPAEAAPSRLALYADGRSVALEVSGQERVEAIAFYGTGLDTRETATRVYWLVADDAHPRRIPAPGPATSAPLVSSYAETATRRERKLYFAALLNGAEDNFFGATLMDQPVTQTLQLGAPIIADGASATLEVSLQGATLDAHDVDVSLAGVTLGRMSWRGRARATRRLELPTALLADGRNDVVLTPALAPGDASLVEHVSLTYERPFVTTGETLAAVVPAGASARLAGFASPEVRVLDVSDPWSPRPLTIALEPAAGGTFAALVSFAPGGAEHPVLAFTPAGVSSVEAVTANRPSSLCSGRGAELVVVSPSPFFEALEPYVAARRAAGWTVDLVDIEDVYDEMSYGAHTTAALSSFVRARLRGAPSPRARYLLLVGDASFDPRNFLGKDVPDFVPTAHIDTSPIETASDDALADLDGDGVPELAVGRWPARTADDVRGFVARTLAFGEATPFARGALVVAGASAGFDFARSAAEARAAVPGTSDLLIASDLAGAAPAALARLWSKGPSFVAFLGHGSQGSWQGLLSIDDLAGSGPAGPPSVVVAMTCLNGFFHDVYADCLAERLLRADQGVAAVWASSGLEIAGAQGELLLAVEAQLGRQASLGEAARRAKAELPAAGRAMVLFGDPTLFGRPTRDGPGAAAANPGAPARPIAIDGDEAPSEGCAVAGRGAGAPTVVGLGVVLAALALRSRARVSRRGR